MIPKFLNRQRTGGLGRWIFPFPNGKKVQVLAVEGALEEKTLTHETESFDFDTALVPLVDRTWLFFTWGVILQ